MIHLSIWEEIWWGEQKESCFHQNSWSLKKLRKYKKFPLFLSGGGGSRAQRNSFIFFPTFEEGEGAN